MLLIPRVARTLPRAKRMTLRSLPSRLNASRFFSDYPDHIRLEMPALSPTMTQGNIGTWHKQEGDKINTGDSYCDVETDKAVVSFDSIEDGYLARILVPDGSNDIEVGTLVGIQVEEEEEIAAFKDYVDTVAPTPAAKEEPAAEAPAAETPAPQTSSTPAAAPPTPQIASTPAADGGRIMASPLAKKTAFDMGVDISGVRGTGPGGRILRADVAEHTPSAVSTTAVGVAPTGAFEDLPHTQMRRVIAQRLTQSKQTIPHYYLTVDCQVDNLLELRKELNGKTDTKISVNDFIIKAAALSLRDIPEVNSSWGEDSIRRYNYVDVSVAVATDTGLITPIVQDADLKGLSTISSNVRELAAKARDGTLLPEEYNGGTFTISNLGMFGIKHFTAIINPPQACIMAVGAAEKRVVPAEPTGEEGEQYETSTVFSATMSCDHRVVDGAVGAQYLQKFKGYIEDPVTMLL